MKLSFLKKCICIKIANILLKVYSNFRDCSGYKEKTDRKIESYEESEKQIRKVKEVMPHFQKRVYSLKEENEILIQRLNMSIYDIYLLDKFIKENDMDAAHEILAKYDFSIFLNKQ